MHELAITQSVFDIVLDQAKQLGAKKVGAVNLTIGEMTGVVGDSVRFYLELLSKDTIVEKAVVNIKSVPAQAKCRECDKQFTLVEFRWMCPDCGGINLEVTGGTELFVESIEVE